jgi:hypothetical protein
MVCREPKPPSGIKSPQKLPIMAIPPRSQHHTSPFWIMRMTELRDVQGYSSSIPGTASARIVGWAGRYFEVTDVADV